MKGFNFNDRSTENIIETPLLLCTFNSVNTVVGANRQNIIGGQTILRQTPNEYGTTTDLLTFTYSLIKKDLSDFTEEEQIKVESWLHSTSYSSKLTLFDCDLEDKYSYKGKFTSTEWIVSAEGFAAVTFNFVCSSAYPYETYSNDFEIDGETEITIINPLPQSQEYSYPVITFSPEIISVTEETPNFYIKNITDNENYMDCKMRNGMDIILDCKHCIPMSVENTIKERYTYKDLGWEDVGNIYWLRLLPGENNLLINGGKGIVNIEFEYPIKKAGAWL